MYRFETLLDRRFQCVRNWNHRNIATSDIFCNSCIHYFGGEEDCRGRHFGGDNYREV